jgi:hypothetical protein
VSDDPESRKKRRRAARVLIALFAVGAPAAGVGITTWGTVPAPVPNVHIPCVDDVCVMCLAPSAAECRVLTRCGGEPCAPELEGTDPYGTGAASILARGLRAAVRGGAFQTFHTDVVAYNLGQVSDCWTQVYMDRDQRAAARRTIDAAGLASDVVDCRMATMLAKGKRNGARLSTLQGADLSNAAAESFPEDEVTSLDAGDAGE